MILPADLAKLVLQQKKTLACFSATKPKCFYRPGHDYSLQAGGWFELPPKTLKERITVESVRRCKTDEVDLRDAKRLGFRSRADFFERWDGSEDVWLVSFVLGVHTDTPRIPAAKFGANGDYTTTASQSLHGSSEEVGSTAHVRFAKEAQEGAQIARNSLYSGHIAKLQAVVQEMRSCSIEPRAHENLRGIERQVASLQRKLTAQV